MRDLAHSISILGGPLTLPCFRHRPPFALMKTDEDASTVACQASVSWALLRMARIRDQNSRRNARKAGFLAPIDTVLSGSEKVSQGQEPPPPALQEDVDDLANLLSATSLSSGAEEADARSPPSRLPLVTGPSDSPLPVPEPSKADPRSASPPAKKAKPEPDPEPSARVSGRKLAKRRASRNSRRAKNMHRIQSYAFGDQEATDRARRKAVDLSDAVHVRFNADALPAAKGGWVGLRGRFFSERRPYTLEELLAGDPASGRPAFKLFRWDDLWVHPPSRLLSLT